LATPQGRIKFLNGAGEWGRGTLRGGGSEDLIGPGIAPQQQRREYNDEKGDPAIQKSALKRDLKRYHNQLSVTIMDNPGVMKIYEERMWGEWEKRK